MGVNGEPTRPVRPEGRIIGDGNYGMSLTLVCCLAATSPLIGLIVRAIRHYSS